MSTWGRLVLLATGAAAGAVAARWATSEPGQQTLGELAQKGRGQLEQVGGSLATREGAPRENRLASRVLRIAQDVKAAMDQRELELRDQLGMATPDQVRQRHSVLSARRTDGTAAEGRDVLESTGHDVVDPG